MRKNYLLLGLALAAGAYLYELLVNLYDKLPLARALTEVSWGRVVFMGLLGGIVARFLPPRSS